MQIPLSDDTVAQAEFEETEVGKVLYLLDRYGVSDDFIILAIRKASSTSQSESYQDELNETYPSPWLRRLLQACQNAVCVEISRLVSILIFHSIVSGRPDDRIN